MNFRNTSPRAAWFALLSGLAGCGVSSPLPQEVDVDAAVDSGAPSATKDAAPRHADAGVVVAVVDSGADKPVPCGAGPGCDPTDLGGETCESLGLGSGRLLCDPATCTFVLSLCTGLPRDASTGRPCGTGPGCTPSDLGGQSCESLGFGSGLLDCDPETCEFDTSLCAGGVPGGAGLGGLGGAVDAGSTSTPLFGGGTTTPMDAGSTGFFGGGFFGGGTAGTPPPPVDSGSGSGDDGGS